MSQLQNFIYQIRPNRAGFGENLTEVETQVMADHAGYLNQLLQAGKLVLAGPCLDFAFGVAILETATEQEARQIMQADPAVSSGVMQTEFHPLQIGFSRMK